MLTLLWQPGLCCDTVLPLLQLKLSTDISKSSEGKQKWWFLPTPSAAPPCPALAAQAHPDTTWAIMWCWTPWWKVPAVCSCQTGGQDSQKMENSRTLCSFKLVVGSLCAQGYDKSHGTQVWCQTLWHAGRIETIMTSRDIICFHVFLLCNSHEASLTEKKAQLIHGFKRPYRPHKLIFQGIKGRIG